MQQKKPSRLWISLTCQKEIIYKKKCVKSVSKILILVGNQRKKQHWVNIILQG